jgi:MICOS complex subunit MIC12
LNHLFPYWLWRRNEKQFSGFTFTTSVLYLTLQYHRSNRLHQQAIIREQTEILNSLASPAGAYYRRFALPPHNRIKNKNLTELEEGDATADEGEQQQQRARPRPGTEEILKHEWNKEIASLARRVFAVRWEDVTETAVEGCKTITRLVKKE